MLKLRTQLVSLLALLWISALSSVERTLAVEELLLRAKPAVALVTTRVDADVRLNCGVGPITVEPSAYRETGTAWFVDGRGYLITSAHVVDPAYRPLPWVDEELKTRAVDQACVDPALAKEGLTRGQQPDREEQIRRRVDRTRITVTRRPQVTVLLSNGTTFPVEIQKFSPPLLLYASGTPTPDSGRDLALLRIREGTYPALGLSDQNAKIGQPVHVLGFPVVVLSGELLNKSARLEASVTTGTISGFKQDAIGQDVIQTDASAAHGNSGSPAVGSRGAVVGVLSFVSLFGTAGSLVQGFNFLIPAHDISEFLQGTEVTRPGDSRFNPIWAAGLEDLRHEHFARAAARFAEANALLPGLVDVKRALAEADYKIKHPSPSPFPWIWITVGAGLVSAGRYGVLWYRQSQRARVRIKPAAPRSMTPPTGEPSSMKGESRFAKTRRSVAAHPRGCGGHRPRAPVGPMPIRRHHLR